MVTQGTLDLRILILYYEDICAYTHQRFFQPIATIEVPGQPRGVLAVYNSRIG